MDRCSGIPAGIDSLGNLGALFYYAKAASGLLYEASLTKLPLRAHCRSTLDQTNYDLVVIGGGIVGAATAREVARRHPDLQIALLEKEVCLASHQSGLNSGVIHQGLYYKPGSLKAKLCVKGSRMLYDYLDEKKIPYNKCGKVVVATNDDEVPILNKIYKIACTNGVRDISLISGEELELYEPHCKGKAAIRSPHTGVVDFAKVARSFGTDFLQSGGKIVFSFEVEKFEMAKENGTIVITSKDEKRIRCRNVITCCGLQSDKVAQMTGCQPDPKVVPFRCKYLVLKRSKSDLVRGNIYPVPDPRFPFLGVHFTPRMDGSIWLGPAVVPSFSRDRHINFCWSEVKEMLTYKGFQRLAFKHWWYGSTEVFKAAIMRGQLKRLQKYIPELTISDIARGPSGAIAQAVNPDGTLVEDFTFDQGTGELGSRVLHVRNAPSPAATSSMAIAAHIADKAQEMFKWKGGQ